MNKINMIGFETGKLKVIKETDKIGNQATWLCQCECGNYVKIQGYELRKHNRTSCGKCNNIGMKRMKHGMYQTRLYNTWENMKARCYRSSTAEFENYGGRGISVCEEWNGEDGFMNFKDWSMNNGYSDKLTLDRINVNGNYEPSNCRWATRKEQMNNRRNNIRLTMEGETHTAKEWSEILNIPYSTIRARIKYGWTDTEKILSNKNYVKEIKL